MLKPASHYRIDWHREFETLAPYLLGNGGVVGVEYDSEEAAADKFNHLLKEDFGRPGNRMWSSMRIDHDWFTTRRGGGILDEIERLLSAAGFASERAPERRFAIDLLSGNDIGGNFTANVENVSIQMGGALAGAALRDRVRVTSEAMRRYVACGGHFMIVVNDAPVVDQSEFWQEIWLGGLAEACGDALLLVIHAGPKARRQYHPESPQLDQRLFIPDSFETDDLRQDQVYDDLFDILKAEGFERPEETAGAFLTVTMSSVRQVHMKLSAVIMNKNKWSGEQKA
jgi:hypothetical protein